MGHMGAALRFGCRVKGIQIHILGGQCWYEGTPSRLESALIVAAGIWVQPWILIFCSYCKVAFSSNADFYT
jgi:hypothetical protein